MADLADRITEPSAEAPKPAAEGAAPAPEADTPPQVDGGQDSGLIDNTYDVEVKLGDLQQNPDSTLYSAQTFQDMNL
jgi:ATP-dependent RNA helicase DDX19/DBP5